MTDPKIPIQNLVFEGGGVKGSAYVGAVSVLDELGLYEGVRNIAGTSAGSITAALLAVGAGCQGLAETVHETDFRRFIADRGGLFGDIARTLTHHGIHTGDEFVAILKLRIRDYAGDPELTFAGLKSLADANPGRFKNLFVVSSNLTTQCPEVFSYFTRPDMKIWQAVRASISIPIVFVPYYFEGHCYVDGGMAWNYPIDLFDKPCAAFKAAPPESYALQATLGFFLKPEHWGKTCPEWGPDNVETESFKTFVSALSDFLYKAANYEHLNPKDHERTVFIDDLGVSGTSFALPKERVEALIESGRQATRAFFKELK